VKGTKKSGRRNDGAGYNEPRKASAKNPKGATPAKSVSTGNATNQKF